MAWFAFPFFSKYSKHNHVCVLSCIIQLLFSYRNVRRVFSQSNGWAAFDKTRWHLGLQHQIWSSIPDSDRNASHASSSGEFGPCMRSFAVGVHGLNTSVFAWLHFWSSRSVPLIKLCRVKIPVHPGERIYRHEMHFRIEQNLWLKFHYSDYARRTIMHCE